MAAFYADENFAIDVVHGLRRRGHDVLTAFEAAQANQGSPDENALTFATQLGRCVLPFDR